MCVSSISSQASADSHSDSSELDFGPLPSARSTDTAAPSSPNIGPESPSTATSASWTQLDLLPMGSQPATSTLSAAASPARTSALPARELVWPDPVPTSGLRWLVSLAKLDPTTSSWKTFQHSLVEDSETFSETWPRSGTMRSGIAYLLPQLVPLTDETGYGLLPTPASTAYGSNQGGAMGRVGPVRLSLESMARQDRWPTPTADDAKNGANRTATRYNPNSKHHDGVTLTDAIRMWPTPRSSPNENRQTKPTPSQLAGEHGMNLSTAVQMWPTPTARDWRSESCSPQVQNKLHAKTRGKTLSWEVTWATPTAGDANIAGVNQHTHTLGRQIRREEGTGLLNPTWVEWLMGFPLEWTVLEPWEMPWSRRSRKLSGKRFKKKPR